jgi:haloalkane dehalogenase
MVTSIVALGGIIMSKNISAEFPFESKFVEIHGSKMHYAEEGSGDPILFLHGNPTSSYLWRNIIPYLSAHGRCIAPDLIGMGKSEKPQLEYRFSDHYKYINGFIEKLELKKITLVIHDWGSGLGFHYAMENENNVKGLAFMEAILKPSSWKDFPKDFKIGFKLMRTPILGWFMISVLNVFLKKVLPDATVRDLTPQEKSKYLEPFKTIGSRKPIRRWPCEIPIDGKPSDMHALVSEYSEKMQNSDLPKLLFYATPGGIISPEMVEWSKSNLKNLQTVNIGPGIHYIQEDNPHKIGEELVKWYKGL